MEWIKKGMIFSPPQNLTWMSSHAALPFADPISDDLFRIYFSGRDREQRAHIGFFDISLLPQLNILKISSQPAISSGPLGSFDDHGVTGSWIVNHNNSKYLFYSGWSLGITVPFYFFIGLAVSDNNGVSFNKISPSPILERNEIDPYLTASPCILIENGIWRMWYVSGTGWKMIGNQPRHYYHIKYAESRDGVKWERQGIVCIDYRNSEEYAIARPCVIKVNNIYKMWYCYRGEYYRIGYAESQDGISWVRKDNEFQLAPSPTGWDSEMTAYPHVFNHRRQSFMLYNGNGYGKTGIGLAILNRKQT